MSELETAVGARALILGAGMTGLACGLASGLPVYEMAEAPGGICGSYYVVPGQRSRLHTPPDDAEAYRFELGGGHWLWGGDPLILRFIQSITPFQWYARRAAVYLPDRDLIIPYPLQNHLSYLGPTTAIQALCQMLESKPSDRSGATMHEWLQAHFGPTLCELFFDPFHELYTAGLWKRLAPQDQSKSPVNLSLAIQGAFDHKSGDAGYNVNFLYPTEGLNALAQRMAQRCEIHYGRRVVRIDVKTKAVHFADGATIPYEALLCTLPLRAALRMASIELKSEADPYTSVLVINIGARKGPRCPREHWLYIPKSDAGFHRVGFYSNVDSSFLPASARGQEDRVSVYVEKAYLGGQKPSEKDTEKVGEAVMRELQAWGWIEGVEVSDPTWIDTAYTWLWPGSKWRAEALRALEAHNIFQVGRYGRWAPQLTDQGIAQSIRDGLWAGASFRNCP